MSRFFDRRIAAGCCLCLLLMLPGIARAEVLKVTMSQAVANYQDRTVQRILRALDNSGFEIEVQVLPGNRALSMAASGEFAMDIYRQPQAIAHFPDLIALEPRVDAVTFGMITSKQAPEKCDSDEAQFGKMSVVGRLGIKLYEDYYYPMFAETVTLDNFDQAFRVLAAQRVDVGFLTRDAFDRIEAPLREQLLFCDTHEKNFPIHSYIHRNYLWAKDRIEAAYRKEFGD